MKKKTVLYLFVHKIVRRFQRERARLFSNFYKQLFLDAGENFIIDRPVSIFGTEYAVVGRDFYAFPGLRLEIFKEHNKKRFLPKLVIGNGVSINNDCHIACVNRIEIGDNVLIAGRVYIADHAHGEPDYSDIHSHPSDRMVTSKGPVIIESDVWIGEGVCILPNVRIGRGSIIGANSVVTKEIPAYSIAAGVPAHVIKQLS